MKGFNSAREKVSLNDEVSRAQKSAPPAVTSGSYNSLITRLLPQAMLTRFINYFLQGAKPRSQWMCGLECELFGYEAERLERLNENQVADVLKSLSSSGDDLQFERDTLSETAIKEGGRLTVEPGGQVEFSSAPRKTLNEVERDYRSYLSRLRDLAQRREFVFLAIGFDPLRKIEEQNWYPKPRYDVMRPYLSSKGARAWDMMTRTCGIQVNLDYRDENDLKKKFVVGNRLAPIVTAMFANSPFENGKPSGYKSTRLATWLETDENRSGISPVVFREDFTLEDFVSYTRDVPMIFTRPNGFYSGDVAGVTFGNYLAQSNNGDDAIFQDWVDHLTTIFTEARLKQYIELRSMDCGAPEMALAAQAFWKGLLYDEAALDEALLIAPKLDQAEMRALQEQIARDGLEAKRAGIDVLSLAKELVSLSLEGLQRIAPDEVKYLEILQQQIIEDEICPADILLRNWYGSWNGSIERLFEFARVA